MIPVRRPRRRRLFSGILARYLADAAVRRPELARRATRLVLASAAAAWQGRVEVTDDPVSAPDWRQPTRTPGPGVPESYLSVQLSAWMLLEGAATAARADVATTVENRDPTGGKQSTELSFVISAPQPTCGRRGP